MKVILFRRIREIRHGVEYGVELRVGTKALQCTVRFEPTLEEIFGMTVETTEELRAKFQIRLDGVQDPLTEFEYDFLHRLLAEPIGLLYQVRSFGSLGPTSEGVAIVEGKDSQEITFGSAAVVLFRESRLGVLID